VSYEEQKSTWKSGVRKPIRRGSAEEEVRKQQDHVTEAWKQISKHSMKKKRRVNVNDLSMVMALRQSTCMDEERMKKKASDIVKVQSSG